MKITSSILIILLLAMAFAPCADASESETSQSSAEISLIDTIGADSVNSGMENQEEECSPICPCQCCPSIASDISKLSDIDTLSPLAHTSEDKLTVYYTFKLSIWSPPRYLS